MKTTPENKRLREVSCEDSESFKSLMVAEQTHTRIEPTLRKKHRTYIVSALLCFSCYFLSHN